MSMKTSLLRRAAAAAGRAAPAAAAACPSPENTTRSTAAIAMSIANRILPLASIVAVLSVMKCIVVDAEQMLFREMQALPLSMLPMRIWPFFILLIVGLSIYLHCCDAVIYTCQC